MKRSGKHTSKAEAHTKPVGEGGDEAQKPSDVADKRRNKRRNANVPTTHVDAEKGADKAESKRRTKRKAKADDEKRPQSEEERFHNELEERHRHEVRLGRLSIVWTILSTAYSIFATCFFIGRKWVNHTMTYVLAGMLAAYILIFIVVMGIAFANPEKHKDGAKGFKKVLGIFRAFANIMFIGLTIADIVALVDSGLDLARLALVILTLFVAIMQLVLRVALFVARIVRRSVSRKYKVAMKRFKDGKPEHKGFLDRMEEKLYND